MSITLKDVKSQELAEYIRFQSTIMADAESNIQIANQVLAERGTTVEEQLDKINEQTTST